MSSLRSSSRSPIHPPLVVPSPTKSLSPVLRRRCANWKGLVKEIVDELDYLKKREEKFADTNLSTNRRVQNFAWFTLVSLIGLGVWQIFHLRAFFKRKYLID
ncbi:emp24/gp25L/p24 family/GOLD-domain-containing protein [Chiua virens]|nr:emp24/gp25L/p24 family/GOLD-domain-containing protein [Chiua virens]